LVILDLDGTLIDTMGSFADLAGGLLHEHYGWTVEEGRKKYLETSGIPFFQQMELLFPDDQRNATVVGLFERGKISAFMQESISEETRETLHILREREVRTAISSNNFHDLVREFVHQGSIPVDVALGFKQNFAKGKDHFEYLRGYFGIPFSEMVFVGDSLMDARKAREMNIFFIARLGTFSGNDFEPLITYQPFVAITAISEILSILEK